ncbi:tetraacyldisaccharide 4'-kinase [Bremerella alba]|uniref:Tetraacyldisaccharide 4'-kinase n=1 Tax=Bremerella alba TaxID=980252 RepID=A0A7V8V792_9BACT|nr:tetraacyldisaccharide 4'-kinase [Bremerella alba]MBA2116264.1 Tetraacyldisaccharide 4'-kinase [Bremerella alba]
MLTARDFKAIVSGRQKGIGTSMLRGLMWVTSLFYGVGVGIRNRQFDTKVKSGERVDVPVISVGNLTLGGTGKTPMVAWLARWFREQDIRVTLISRGYGAEQGAQNDEAKELEQLLPDVPHLQNPDRVAAAQVAAEELAAQVLLLDDAFQHRRIARDLDIVLIDATEPFGYDYLFPRGTLREPVQSLGRADVIVLTRGDMVSEQDRAAIWERIVKLDHDAVLVEMRHQPSRLLNDSGKSQTIEQLQGKKVLAFCGIGNPSGFRHTLNDAGIDVVELREFDDHHAYQREDIHALEHWTTEHNEVDAVVCTHKDLVKIGLDRFMDKPLWALTIEAQIVDGQAELEERLRELVAKIPADPYADY